MHRGAPCGPKLILEFYYVFSQSGNEKLVKYPQLAGGCMHPPCGLGKGQPATETALPKSSSPGFRDPGGGHRGTRRGICAAQQMPPLR